MATGYYNYYTHTPTASQFSTTVARDNKSASNDGAIFPVPTPANYGYARIQHPPADTFNNANNNHGYGYHYPPPRSGTAYTTSNHATSYPPPPFQEYYNNNPYGTTWPHASYGTPQAGLNGNVVSNTSESLSTTVTTGSNAPHNSRPASHNTAITHQNLRMVEGGTWSSQSSVHSHEQ